MADRRTNFSSRRRLDGRSDLVALSHYLLTPGSGRSLRDTVASARAPRPRADDAGVRLRQLSGGWSRPGTASGDRVLLDRPGGGQAEELEYASYLAAAYCELR